MPISMIHCTKHDAVFSDGLISLGALLVALAQRGISRDKILLREMESCEKCIVGRCNCNDGQVRTKAPEALFGLLK